MVVEPSRRANLMELGIEHCRVEEWDLGFRYLSEALADGVPQQREGALAASFLGFAMARQGSVREGLRLCRRALRMGASEPEIHLNLARLYLEVDRRAESVRVLDQGLAIEPENTALLVLRHQLGRRRSRVLQFLPRGHLVNRALGRLRHRWTS
jgi:predicted Zn-dependent protease